MSSTVCNAYVQPLTERYLQRIDDDLREQGFDQGLYMMLSSGGITTLDRAARFPVRLVESGPAAGALAASFYGGLTGESELMSFDMGGTTAKMCLIRDGTPTVTDTFEIARVHRFKRGSGLPVRVPTIELIEIGAGGGSIARIDELGLLKVGPDSAGADPGPASYGQGGTEPTVTDADALLGYLNPDYFLGGRMSLDTAAAERAVETLAEPLGLDVLDVRLKQTALPLQNLEATFARMRAEREREATDERARGEEAAQRVRAQADRTVVELVSEANREGEIARGEADAQRNAIFAEAFGTEQEFFEFYRSMTALSLIHI